MNKYENYFSSENQLSEKTIRRIKTDFGEGSTQKGWENWFWAARCLCKYDTESFDSELVGKMANEAIRLGLTYRANPTLYIEAVQILVTVSTTLKKYEDLTTYLALILETDPSPPDWVYLDFVSAQMHTNDIWRMLKYPRKFLENLHHEASEDADTPEVQKRIFEDFLLEGAVFLSKHPGTLVNMEKLQEAALEYGCDQSRKWGIFQEAAKGKEISLLEIEKLRHPDEPDKTIPADALEKIAALEQELSEAQERTARLEEEIRSLRKNSDEFFDNSDPQVFAHIQMYLRKTQTSLHSLLKKALPLCADQWWNELVLGKFSFDQLENIHRNHYSKLSEFDLPYLLRTLRNNLSVIKRRGGRYLGTLDASGVDKILSIRNRWAHVGADFPMKGRIRADIFTLADFLDLIGGSEADRKEMQKYANSIR